MYYKLTRTPVMSGLYMTREPNLGPMADWLSGQLHYDSVKIPNPLEIELDSQYGTGMGDYFDDSLPICSDRMLEALRRAGVDNLVAYEAVLLDPGTGERFEGYWALQIVGRIGAADLDKSDAVDPLGVGHTVVQFHDLVIDEKKILDARLFRMHESASTVLVHEGVKLELEKANLDLVSVLPVGERAIPVLESDGGD